MVFQPQTNEELYQAVEDWGWGSTAYGNISDWDVSLITSMRGLFDVGQNFVSSFNDDISRWDVSNVTDMNSMFRRASDFNQPIGNWDVSSVTDMGEMFYRAYDFNQPVGEWDVSSVVNMTYMFYSIWGFNQSIDNWDVSSVENMMYMFQNINNADWECEYMCWDLSDAAFLKRDEIGVTVIPGPRYSTNVVGGQCFCAENQELNITLGNRGVCERDNNYTSTSISQCENVIESGLGSLLLHTFAIVACFALILVVHYVNNGSPKKSNIKTKNDAELGGNMISSSSNNDHSSVGSTSSSCTHRVRACWTPLVALLFFQVLALTDFITDTLVYLSVGKGDADFPCSFGGRGNMVSCEVIDFDRELDFGDTCNNCDSHDKPLRHFDAVCTFNDLFEFTDQREAFEKSCINNFDDSLYGCNCRNFVDFEDFHNSVGDIDVYAGNALFLLILKESLKLILLLLSSCCACLRAPRWLKFAIDSPFSFVLMLVPKFRAMILQTKKELDESKAVPLNLLVDLLMEDIPGLVVPLWYMYHAEPGQLQILSFYLTNFSIIRQVLVLITSIIASPVSKKGDEIELLNDISNSKDVGVELKGVVTDPKA